MTPGPASQRSRAGDRGRARQPRNRRVKGRRRRGDGAPSDTTGRDPVISKEPTPQPPRRKARGLFTGAEEPVGDPWDRVATSFRVPGNRSGTRGTGRPPPADRSPTSTHHTTTTKRRTSTEPIILRVCRAAKGLRSGGTRPGSGPRRGASGISGTSGTRGERGAPGTSGREVLERLKRSRGDLRKTL